VQELNESGRRKRIFFEIEDWVFEFWNLSGA
jgi:hypothetical protein